MKSMMIKMTKLTIAYLLTGLCLFSCAISRINSGNPYDGGNSGGSETVPLTGVFVATNGNDTNSGTNYSKPLRTFAAAVSNARANSLTNIYVAAGTYKPGTGLRPAPSGLVITNSSLNISGGWDSNFQNTGDYSVLDGTNGLDHVVYAKNVSNLTFQGFFIKNGRAVGNDTANTNGSGMYLSNMTACLFTNIIVSNNYALGNGGGVWISGISNKFCADVLSNYANYAGPYNGFGGGVYVGPGSYRNVFSGNVSFNIGLGGGGMFFGTNTGRNEIYCNLEKNVACALEGGGGISFYHSSSNHYNGLVNGNYVTFMAGPACYAGGVFINYGHWNFIEGIICSNTAYSGGGGCVNYGTNNTIQAYIYDNMHNAEAYYWGWGIGLYLRYNGNTTVSGIIMHNHSSGVSSYGGGMAIVNSTVFLTNLIVTGNSSPGTGGIFSSGSTLTTNGAYIYDNSPTDF